MAARVKSGDPQQLLTDLQLLLCSFEELLEDGELRDQVQALVPALKTLKRLGVSLPGLADTEAAINRILLYLRRFSGHVIRGEELEIVSGISEYARRVRELRVQEGWPIYTGVTVRGLLKDSSAGELGFPPEFTKMKPDDYVLVEDLQDRDAAHRWHTANRIRKMGGSTHDRILAYLKENVGHPVTGEELRYVANDVSEWARRVRELRTEQGWPLVTKTTGEPGLPVGSYLLLSLDQAEPHDRKIPDDVRVAVLERDRFACLNCDWTLAKRHPGDPRQFLELHHLEHHVKGGKNEKDNLATLCNVCHDKVHADRLDESELRKKIPE